MEKKKGRDEKRKRDGFSISLPFPSLLSLPLHIRKQRSNIPTFSSGLAHSLSDCLGMRKLPLLRLGMNYIQVSRKSEGKGAPRTSALRGYEPVPMAGRHTEE